MKMDQYQEFTRSVAIYPEDKALEYCTLGLVGEAGEIANKVKKVIRDNNSVLTEEKRADLIAELGDTLWYLTRLCDELGVSIKEVAFLNKQKLLSRKERNALGGSGDTR